jgi:hypothetical protein
MSKEKTPTDKVALMFGVNDYLIKIFPEPLDARPIKSLWASNVAGSVEGIASELISYHQRCVVAMKAKETMRPSVYQGAGSDKGRWEELWMTRWKFENEAQLTETQENLLEGIVFMRNSYVDVLEELDEYSSAPSSTG